MAKAKSDRGRNPGTVSVGRKAGDRNRPYTARGDYARHQTITNGMKEAKRNVRESRSGKTTKSKNK